MNNLIISGRLTRDPESKQTQSGELAKFSVAVDNFGRDKGATFFDCVAFGKTGEYVNKYITKGRSVIVQGRIESNKGSDGKVYWSVNASSVEATDKPKDDAPKPTGTTTTTPENFHADEYDPFGDE